MSSQVRREHLGSGSVRHSRFFLIYPDHQNALGFDFLIFVISFLSVFIHTQNKLAYDHLKPATKSNENALIIYTLG